MHNPGICLTALMNLFLLAIALPTDVQDQVAQSDGSLLSQKMVQSVVTPESTCCKVLSLLFRDKVAISSSNPYKQSLASYWSAQEQAVQPSCIYIPKTAKDVAAAVFVLNIASKLIKGCEFAVRGGGHTPFAGSANIQNGVTIDLQSFKQLDISQDQSQISIGPGNRWEDVYLKLDALQLATSGGRVASIVLASGQIVNANAKSYPDLFKALKGGSNNFGIVTRFDMKVFKQGKFWGGFIGQDISTRETQFKLFETFAKSKGYDPYAAFINSYSFNAQSGWFIASSFEYTKPETRPLVFKPFIDLPQTFNTMRISNLTDFTVELEGRNLPGQRQLFVTGTFKNSAATMKQYFDLSNQTLQPIKDTPGLSFSLSFQPLPQEIINNKPPGNTPNSGNVLGLGPEDGDLTNALLTVSWSDIKDDDTINKAAQDLFVKVNDAAKKLNTFNPYLYLNYAAKFQNPIGGYGQDSLTFLQKVSKQYDPLQLFQNLVPGGFKLNVPVIAA
ncbi:uncharacterized protein KY384_005343 [Bacidia gigantensis]|uniref:uncharacterized protein n=1 Tax=Bacidia gigantensis TaxID=2732470 RepID=UPI001D05360E|nr:uncharacterized protein KY384_005343 [Bacidia gigantensis]KAG8529862.1 hypothetical protein KY384_005343 [Bacidia gigantensis]